MSRPHPTQRSSQIEDLLTHQWQPASDCTTTLRTQAVMVLANIALDGKSAQQKVELAGEIYVQQRNLLASILVWPRYGVDMLRLEVPAHVLLVAFQAMKHCGHALPTIAETSRKPARSG